MAEHPRVVGVTSKQGTSLARWINTYAEQHGAPPQGLLALILAESGLDEQAARYGAWPDVSFGLGQQTVAYAPVGNQQNTPENIAFVRDYYCSDPQTAIRDAAKQFGAYYRQAGDWRDALSKYNGGPAATWTSIPTANRANYQLAYNRAAAYLEDTPMAGPQSWVFPVAGPHDYADEHWDGHKAVDIFAPHSTLLVAVQDGTAVVADYPLGGHTVTLYTRDGYVCYHAHLVQNTGIAGPVRQGDALGLVGNTGNAATTPPHCHWAVGTKAYGIDNNGAGDVAPWPLLRAIEAGAGEEPEDMGQIEDLRAQLAECERAGQIAVEGIDEALGHLALVGAYKLSKRAKVAVADAQTALEAGAKPAAETAARGGLPREE